MKQLIFSLIAILFFGLLMSHPANAEAESKVSQPIIGRVEYVRFDAFDFKFKARIDTGAGVSSIHARIDEVKKPKSKDEVEKIVFTIEGPDGETTTMEKEVVEWARIKKKAEEEYIDRPVVKLSVCLAGHAISGRFNLADRGHFLYPVLIGRNILKQKSILVDSQLKFTKDPVCNEK